MLRARYTLNGVICCRVAVISASHEHLPKHSYWTAFASRWPVTPGSRLQASFAVTGGQNASLTSDVILDLPNPEFGERGIISEHVLSRGCASGTQKIGN